MTIKEKVIKELKTYAEPDKIEKQAKFFQAFPGGYAEGDKFLGVTVPNQRKVSRKFYKDATPNDCTDMLRNEYHEVRLTGLFIMVHLFEKNNDPEFRKEIIDVYLCNAEKVNNWDLVDSSAYKLLGPYLEGHDKNLLYMMAENGILWEKRIAMIATYHYIKQNQFDEALKVAEILLNEEHDLLHKAVGWMLREIGNRNYDTEIHFLNKHYKKMPRTMLRYAIEKFPEDLRKSYLHRIIA